MKVKNIRLRTVEGFIRLAEPSKCSHEWEHHLWEPGTAYCPLCGSFAEKDERE